MGYYFDIIRIVEHLIAIAALGALAHEHRLAVVRLLLEHAPAGLPAGAIGERLGLAPATLSFHLKELARAGLVATQPDGRFIWYRANLATMNGLVAYLDRKLLPRAGHGCVLRSAHPETAHRRADPTGEPRMKRFHVHLGVEDLDRSIGFYSNLFGAEPSVRKDDYAKWMLDDPRINFAISRRGGASRARSVR